MTLGVTGKLILAFFTLIIGIVLIGSIATQGLLSTEKKLIVGESKDLAAHRGNNLLGINLSYANFTATNSPTSWKRLDCPLTSVTYRNGSDDFTITTDYTIGLDTGVLSLKNSTNILGTISNTTYLDYTYCGDDYLNSTWGRTVLLLVAGFFALAILGASLGLFFSIAKETGLI